MNKQESNSNKVALLAGATDGIGFAFLRACLGSNLYTRYYVLGRNFQSIRALNDDRLVPLHCDILDGSALENALTSIKEPVDSFVNTIGTFHKKRVQDLSAEEIRDHFALNAIANITLTTLVVPKLNTEFSQILVCLATLAIEPRETYSLQSSTKASYRIFLRCLRKEIGMRTRIMMIHPSSAQTGIFKKSGDQRSVSGYPKPEVIAEMMTFMLSRPSMVEIPELIVRNRT